MDPDGDHKNRGETILTAGVRGNTFGKSVIQAVLTSLQ